MRGVRRGDRARRGRGGGRAHPEAPLEFTPPPAALPAQLFINSWPPLAPAQTPRPGPSSAPSVAQRWSQALTAAQGLPARLCLLAGSPISPDPLSGSRPRPLNLCPPLSLPLSLDLCPLILWTRADMQPQRVHTCSSTRLPHPSARASSEESQPSTSSLRLRSQLRAGPHSPSSDPGPSSLRPRGPASLTTAHSLLGSGQDPRGVDDANALQDLIGELGAHEPGAEGRSGVNAGTGRRRDT